MNSGTQTTESRFLMASNARKHVVPGGGDASVSRATIFEAFGNTIHDVVPVANATEAAQVVADLVDAGVGPSTTHPLVVHRADARGLHRLEYTVDGSVWLPASGVLSFANVGARDSWTTANSAYLSVRDRCRIGSTEYWWNGSAWAGTGGPTTTPTYQSSTWVAHSEGLEFWVKADGMIGVEGGFQNVGAGTFNAGLAGVRVGDIPAALRPSRIIKLAASQTRAAAGLMNHATVFIEPDGEIFVSLSATDTYAAGALQVFVAGEYRPA